MVHNRNEFFVFVEWSSFASLVKLKEYPYALEVDDATFKRMKRFIVS